MPRTMSLPSGVKKSVNSVVEGGCSAWKYNLVRETWSVFFFPFFGDGKREAENMMMVMMIVERKETECAYSLR